LEILAAAPTLAACPESGKSEPGGDRAQPTPRLLRQGFRL